MLNDKAIPLNQIFAHTVAGGWAPRRPAGEHELAQLEIAMTRGDCISPLLQAGDVIYIDRTLTPQPCDIVSFVLSERGADFQNSNLPTGQSPWKAGARWCKLYADYHGIPMLFDRHGGAASATLLACESPDDLPVLHPVRNIRRAGRLLYGHVHHCSQIGINAATDVSQNIVNYSGSTFGFGNISLNDIAFTPGFDCLVEVTAQLDCKTAVGYDAGQFFAVFLDPAWDGSGFPSGSTSYGVNTAAPTSRVTITLTASFAVTAGTTYHVGVASKNAVGGGSNNTVWSTIVMKELIKR